MRHLLSTGLYLIYLVMFFVVFDLFSGFALAKIKLNPLFWSIFPDEFSIISQTSKAGIKPQRPIVLLGDSYAAGVGDWFESQKGSIRIDQFHSAHIIHKLTGKDVITLGQGGAGNQKAIAETINHSYSSFSESWLYQIQYPESIIIYFHEGNDLQDNIEWIAAKSNCSEPFSYERSNDPDYIRRYIERNIKKVASNTWSQRILDNFHISHAFAELIDLKKTTKDSGYSCSPYNRFGRVIPWEQGTNNKALINSEVTPIADHIQASPIELTKDNNDSYAFALELFQQSLLILKDDFPDTPIGLLFIPAVASSYEIQSDTVIIQNYLGPKPLIFTKEELDKSHIKTVRSISDIAQNLNITFHNATPLIRKASENHVIHGPTDWNHFNQKGYQALGKAASELHQKMQ